MLAPGGGGGVQPAPGTRERGGCRIARTQHAHGRPGCCGSQARDAPCDSNTPALEAPAPSSPRVTYESET